MHHPHSSRFLKTASFVIAFGILVFGTLVNEKNANFATAIKPSLNEASIAATTAKNSIPAEIGYCEQNTKNDYSEKSIFASADNFDKIITGAAVLDSDFWNPLASAIEEGRIESKIVEPGKEYEFAVKDGQFDFWKCVLAEIPLFSSVSEFSAENDFFSKTASFESQIKKFGYAAGDVDEVELFLNFVELPADHRILETTVLAEGETFFKLFEVELLEGTSYNDLRQDLRDLVGITNLRPAVFGADSYYWMWGAEDRMAASVFLIEGKVFGVSYQTAHFKHIRRVVDALLEKFDLLAEKVDIVKSLGGAEFADLTINKFENLDLESLDSEIVEALKQLGNSENISAENLSSNILKITPIKIPIKITEDVENIEFDEFTPIKISADALESLENSEEEMPLDL